MSSFLTNLIVMLFFTGVGLLLALGASLRYTKKGLLWWLTASEKEDKPDYKRTRLLLYSVLVLAVLSVFLGVLFPSPTVYQSPTAGNNLATFVLIAFFLSLVVWYLQVKNVWRRTNKPDAYGSAELVTEDKDLKTLQARNTHQARGARVELGFTPNNQPFSWQTDKHVLLIASARSGKGTDIIIPNLLSYDGPVFVLDPKGENARATARRRKSFGEVHCLDPWGLMYIGQLSEKVSTAAVEAARQRGEPTEGVLHAAGTRTKAAIGELEKVLKGQPVSELTQLTQKEGSPSYMIYPKNNGELSLTALVPVNAGILPLYGHKEGVAAAVCANLGTGGMGRTPTALGAWIITNTGKVVPIPVIPNPPERAGSIGCQATLSKLNRDFKDAMAAAVGAAPQSPPVVVGPKQ